MSASKDRCKNTHVTGVRSDKCAVDALVVELDGERVPMARHQKDGHVTAAALAESGRGPVRAWLATESGLVETVLDTNDLHHRRRDRLPELPSALLVSSLKEITAGHHLNVTTALATFKATVDSLSLLDFTNALYTDLDDPITVLLATAPSRVLSALEERYGMSPLDLCRSIAVRERMRANASTLIHPDHSVAAQGGAAAIVARAEALWALADAACTRLRASGLDSFDKLTQVAELTEALSHVPAACMRGFEELAPACRDDAAAHPSDVDFLADPAGRRFAELVSDPRRLGPAFTRTVIADALTVAEVLEEVLGPDGAQVVVNVYGAKAGWLGRQALSASVKLAAAHPIAKTVHEAAATINDSAIAAALDAWTSPSPG